MTATSLSLSHSGTFTFILQDFALSASPAGVTANSGTAGGSTLTATSVNGFAGTVALSATVSPSTGLTCTISPSNVPLGTSGSATLSCNGSAGSYAVTVTGNSGSLSHTSTVTYFVQDFSITVSPLTITFSGGQAGTATVTVTSLNGFTGAVALTTTVSPSIGLSCTMSPGSITLGTLGTSTLSCGGSVGLYTVTVGGGSGLLSHSATVTYTVQDFTLVASPVSVSVNAGIVGSSTITLTAVSGFVGSVSISSSVAPSSGLTCSLAPVSVTLGSSGGSTLSCSGSAGLYDVTVTGTSGPLSHQAKVTYTIQDFTITSAPATVTAYAGNPGSSTVTVTSLNGFAANVGLAATVSPSIGLSCSLNPSTVALSTSGTTTLTCNGSVGSYTVTVTGTSAGLSHSALVVYTVQDFTLSVGPASVTIPSGAPGSSTLVVTGVNGFTGTVALSTSVNPTPGPTCATTPAGVVLSSSTASGTSVLSCNGNLAGNYIVTISGTSNGISHVGTVTIQITDFAMSANPISVSAVAGTASSSTVSVTQANGFTGVVTLVQSSSPSAGLTCNLNPSSVTVGSSVSTSSLFCTGSPGSAGVYFVTITGTSGQLSHSATVTVTVQDFTLTSSATSISINAGASGTSTITVASQNLFNGVVSLTASFAPSTGLSCTLNPTNVTPTAGGSSTSTLACTSTTAVTYTVTVTGTSGSLTHSATVLLAVQDFVVSPNPLSVGVNAGAQGASVITAVPLNGWSGTVSLSATAPVSGLTCNLSLTSISGSTPSTLSCAGIAGTYSVLISGNSGSLSHSATVSYTVRDFTLVASSPSVTVDAGSVAQSPIVLSPSFGFTGTVSLTLSVSPSTGLGCNLDSTILTLGSSGTAMLSCSGSAGVYTVTISATSTGLSRTTAVLVTVQEPIIRTSPDSVSVSAGTFGNSTITLAGQNGFTRTVSLSQPSISPSSGLRCQLSTTVVTIVSGNPSSVTLSCKGSTAGIYHVTVTADFGGSPPPRSVVVVYTIQDFTVDANPLTVTLNSASAGQTNVTVTSQNGFTGSIPLSASVNPSTGLTCNLASPTVNLQLSGTRGLSCTGKAGTYIVTVTGAIGSLSHSVVITYKVQDFVISPSPTQVTIVSGSTGTTTITLTGQNDFNGNATLTASPMAGTELIAPVPTLGASNLILTIGVNASSTLTITSVGVTPGTYFVTVNATIASPTTGRLSHQISFSITVTPAPMIRIPSTLSVVAGSTIRFSVNVTDSDLSKTVTLTASGLPQGATFNTALGTGTFNGILSWAPSDSQASHDYNVTFTADDGHGGVAITQMTLHVNPRVQTPPLLSGSQYWFLGLAGFGVAVMTPLLLRIVRRTVSKGKTALLSNPDL